MEEAQVILVLVFVGCCWCCPLVDWVVRSNQAGRGGVLLTTHSMKEAQRGVGWVVRSNKAGRGVLLTTHSMKEAQVILVIGVCGLLLLLACGLGGA
jgi:ABC-type multidrug transport system ATPase subunit